MVSSDAYSLCRVEGTPRGRGRGYGQWIRDPLRRFLDEELYGAMERRHRLRREDLRGYAEACLPYIRTQTPRAWAFLEGLSEASGMDLPELAVILAHEEYYHGLDPISHHCSGLAVGPSETSDGQVYIGQNWDWMESMRPYRHLLHQTGDDGLRTLTYAYPGLWASAGMNSAGVALVWVGAGYDHAASHGGRPRAGVPSYALIAEMLEQSSLDKAVDCALNVQHAGWFIFLLAGRDGRLARIEATPETKACHRPPSKMAANIIYTDEQVRRSALQADFGPVPPHWPKYARMCDLLMSYSGRLDRERLFSFLRDHVPEPKEASICGHNATLDGFLFSPTLNRAWFIPGPPCQHEASEYEI